MKRQKNKIAIIVPVFNEEKIISWVIKELMKVSKKIGADIYIVNDGSTDNTLNEIKPFLDQVRVISSKNNHGKGYALRKGTDQVYKKYQTTIWIDGDGQLIPSDIEKMLKFLTADTDLIISNRIINFKVLPTSKIGRRLVRYLFNFLFSSKIKDHLSGLRVFRSKIYPKIRWQANDYRVEIESLARAVVNKVKYKEARTVCNKKLYRGIEWDDGLKIYYWIFWCYFNRSKLIYRA